MPSHLVVVLWPLSTLMQALEKEHDGRDPVPKAMKAKGVVLSNQAACVCVCVCAEEEKEGGVDCIGTRCPAGRKKERVCALLLCVRSRRTQAAARHQGSKALRLGATHLCPPSRRFCLGSTVHTHPPFPREKKVNEAARWAWIFLLASIAPVSSGLRQRTAAGWAKQHLIDFFRPLTEIAECDDVQDSGHKQASKQEAAIRFFLRSRSASGFVVGAVDYMVWWC